MIIVKGLLGIVFLGVLIFIFDFYIGSILDKDIMK